MTDTIDHEALRRKYAAERDKRIRPDGPDQYVEPTGRFAHFVDDPYVERVEREPLTDEVTVAVIGAGFGGLCTGARLKQAGIDDIRLIDVGGDVGGAWYWNRYPGAMCDTAAMIYLPLLEETNYLPSKKYVEAPEIWGHAKRIAETFGLYENAVFSTAVRSITWDEDARRWIIRTDRDDAMRAKFVCISVGPLHRPKLPGIPGIETFGGHCFHTSRWDYDYTGGDALGAPMDKLADKRVGIVGTGATAIQAIPHLARSAGELYVFQRTPSSVDERNNHPIDAADYDLHPGWQDEWRLNFATLQTGGFTDVDLVKDGWTDIAQRIRDRVVAEVQAGAELTPETIAKAFEDSDDEKMEEIRARAEAIVDDPATAEALKPWYRQLCKRPCFHDDYLQAYNNPNTHLVDTDGKGVERIDETGAWVGGVHYDLDCLIYASGFEFNSDFSHRTGYDVIGRDGLALSDKWADGMQSFHGYHVHGYPNLFIVGMAQNANLVSNITHNLVEAGTTIASVVSATLEAGADEVEATETAEKEWVAALSTGPGTFLGSPDCTPGYYNNEGGPIGERERLNFGGYHLGPVGFFDHIHRWRDAGDLEGLELRADGKPIG